MPERDARGGEPDQARLLDRREVVDGRADRLRGAQHQAEIAGVVRRCHDEQLPSPRRKAEGGCGEDLLHAR